MSDQEVPPPDIQDKPAWAKDSRATIEDKNWGDEKLLRGQRIENDLRWLKVYGWVLVGVTICFVLLFCGSLGVWAWHQLTPWTWLENEKLSKIQSVIFSGSLGAIVSTIAQRQISKQ